MLINLHNGQQTIASLMIFHFSSRLTPTYTLWWRKGFSPNKGCDVANKLTNSIVQRVRTEVLGPNFSWSMYAKDTMT